MKIFLTISFTVLIGLICLTTLSQSHKCVEYEEPIYRYKHVLVDCPMVTVADKRQTPSTTPDNMFTVDFSCLVNDTNLCNKVKNVFVTAGKYITATLNLKSVVSVKAQFLDFCQRFQDCNTEEIILGAAGPARMIPFQDTDGKIRLLPQALYKQMNLPEHPQFGPNEIMATFNANMSYWFEGDPLPMRIRQADMLYVVLHELIHGLGFINSWSDYMGIQALTPLIGGVTANNAGTASPAPVPVPAPASPAQPGPVQGLPQNVKGQFLELIFDKNLVLLPTGQSLTSITDELNKFPINLAAPNNIITSFINSPQYPIAKTMYQNAVTHGKMGFLLTPGDPPNTPLTPDQIQNNVLVVETSLNPFASSSSIGHADFQTYINSSDFLMLFTYPPGKTLDQMLARFNTTNTTGPIGPKLRTVLGILGYDVKNDYTPPVITTGLQDNTTTTKSNTSNKSNDKKSNSSIVRFNLILSLVGMLIANCFRY